MSKIVGIRPQQETKKLIDKFEDEVMIRHNNQPLIGTVYVDMQEDRWSVAFAYNYSRKPGLHGTRTRLRSGIRTGPRKRRPSGRRGTPTCPIPTASTTSAAS